MNPKGTILIRRNDEIKNKTTDRRDYYEERK